MENWNNHKKNRAAQRVARLLSCENLISNYFAGAGAGAAVAAGAAGAAVAAGIAVAAGAGVAAGASTFGASAGFCSSFLQPTTARDREAKKSTLTKMANIFFIKAYPPFTDFHNFGVFYCPNF